MLSSAYSRPPGAGQGCLKAPCSLFPLGPPGIRCEPTLNGPISVICSGRGGTLLKKPRFTSHPASECFPSRFRSWCCRAPAPPPSLAHTGQAPPHRQSLHPIEMASHSHLDPAPSGEKHCGRVPGEELGLASTDPTPEKVTDCSSSSRLGSRSNERVTA